MQSFRTSLISAALAAFLAAPLAAQDAPAPAAPAADATAPAADAPAAPAAAPATDGTPAPAEGTATPAPGAEAAPTGQPGQQEVMEVVKETFGDWQVRCAPQGNECFLYQLAIDQNKNPVAEISILKLPEAAEADAGVTIVTPLGTLLPNGVGMQIDGGQARQYPFAWCSQVGCFARFGLSNPDILSMKRGKGGKIMLISVAAPDHPVVLDLSLTGFTAAYNSLVTPPNPPGMVAAPNPAAAPAKPAPAKPLPSLQPKN